MFFKSNFLDAMRGALQRHTDRSELEPSSSVQHRVIKLSKYCDYELFYHVSREIQAEQEDDMQMIPSCLANRVPRASLQTVHLIFLVFEQGLDWLGICERDDIKIHDRDSMTPNNAVASVIGSLQHDSEDKSKPLHLFVGLSAFCHIRGKLQHGHGYDKQQTANILNTNWT